MALIASPAIALWLVIVVATVGAIVRLGMGGSDTDHTDRLKSANATHDGCPVHHNGGDTP